MKLSININAISMCESFTAEISRSDFPSYALALVSRTLELSDLKAKLTDEIMSTGSRPRFDSQNRKRITLKDGCYVHARVMELSDFLGLPANHIFERLCAISWKNRHVAQASMGPTPPAAASEPSRTPARQHQLLQETKLICPPMLKVPLPHKPTDPDVTDYSSFPGVSF